MKLLTVVGARPQFIKAAAVSRAVSTDSNLTEVIVHTGQHYDRNMSDVFFSELGIPVPAYNLGIGSGSHGVQTGRMLASLEEVLLQEQPDWVVVHGDTNSTLAGALAAVKLHIPVAHVEAGLRSLNRRMPEEINRILSDHAADRLYAPTEAAVVNLRREGLSHSTRLVGDVMYDAALYFGARAEQVSSILNRLKLSPGSYVLATVHRAENTDAAPRLRAILDGLTRLSYDLTVVLPLHPRTKASIAHLGLDLPTDKGLRMIEPVGYLDMIMLEKNARAIATDSGGVQKEAFFYEVPCATLRAETEWGELVELGWNRLVPPSSGVAVFEAVRDCLDSRGLPGRPYGNGDAASKIVADLRGE